MSAAPGALKSSTSMPRSSSCRARLTGSRICAEADAQPSGLPGKPNRLQYRPKIVEAVYHDRQPGRIEAIAQITEPKPDAKHLAEEEPIVLQMQPGPHQGRQQDRAGSLEHRLRPAAVEKAACEQLFRDR